MASAKDVRNRIKSVKNIGQITRALEAVSASRVRRAQDRAFASRNFAEKAWEILLNLNAAASSGTTHPLLEEREEISSILIVLITSDRGLAGAFNTNIMRVAEQFASGIGKPVKYVAVGRKGRDSLIRQGKEVIAEFSDLPANLTVADISPIAKICVDEFLSGNVDEVLIAYTDFINMITQSPVALGWLPLTPNTIAEQVASEYVKDVPQVTEGTLNYDYEPSAEAVLDEIVPRFTELQLYQALLESQASEHAARMTAMHNATDNASQLVGDLTLEYNKARQASITNEILDIVGGASALEATLKAKAAAKKAQPAASNGASKPKTQVTAAKADNPDDLTKIEGIGKKMSQALIDGGIDTFAKVADSSINDYLTTIEAAGMRFAPSAESWAEQASYAAKGDWDGLETLQDRLISGRYPESIEPDDLTKIEGIGPKMSKALIAAGIDKFAKLAKSSENTLSAAIEAAGMRLAPSLGTWAEQAEFAAKGDWDGLNALQDKLQGGRRVD